MTPHDTVLQEMLGRYDATLKKMFAWYASLPNLTGPVSWDQFKNNHKGMLSGHLVLLLTNFKVRSQPCHTGEVELVSTRSHTNYWCMQHAVVCRHCLPFLLSA